MPRIPEPKSPLVRRLKGLHLFHFDGATCAQRVRFVLGEKGLSRGRDVRFDAATAESLTGECGKWVSRLVSLARKENMSSAYAEINPNMVVPALVHDGSLYLESMDIIEYLDQTFGPPFFIPQAAPMRESTMSLVELAKELHLSLRYVTFRWGLGRLAMLNLKERRKLEELAAQGTDGEKLVPFYNAYSTRTIPEHVFAGHLIRLHQAFTELDRQLADGRPFLMGDSLTIADVFWSMKMLRLVETGYPFSAYHPRVDSWFKSMYERPAFQNEVMGRNRFNNRVFRTKAAIENALGKGLKPALESLLQGQMA